MVDFLMRCQFFLVQFGYKLFLTPNDVPLIIVDFCVTSVFKCLKDAVAEVRFEFDGGSTWGYAYIWE